MFYNTYYERFVRYALYYVNDKPTAEDMTHDALLYYWENRHKLPSDTDILGYILLSVKNKCLNYLKHLKVEIEYSKNCTDLHGWEIITRIQTLEDESYGVIFSKDITKIIMESLSELPEQTQNIFILNRLKNKSRKEISMMLGVSQQKIDYHVNKANDHLLKKLKDYIPFILLLLN
ncbi:RNA polymerase sigma-70 factor [Parabacteroides sp. HGS0025]|uniref:RNA polymerase sigma-70 factor n=1 Tax=Parabacteroides sp. HGS0025 TaxID=1078087 RepID=UPI001E376430|nr:RNA polymerase sigma-70 factor [Parabacteroides sp. HGS0025]